MGKHPLFNSLLDYDIPVATSFHFCHIGVYMAFSPSTNMDRKRVPSTSGRSQRGGAKASKSGHSRMDPVLGYLNSLNRDKLSKSEFQAHFCILMPSLSSF